MSGPWGAESGRDDAGFLARLRELLEDYPIRAVEQFSPNGTMIEGKCSQVKINDDKDLQVVSSGSNIPITFNRDDVAAGNCFVDCNTGWILFGAPPAAGNNKLIVYKNRVRWRDSQMIQALYGGLLFLYPKRFREAIDTSIQMVTNRWDYTLPDDFNIPDIFISSISIREIPSSVNRYKPVTGWSRYGTTLRFVRSQRFSPGSNLEIRYTAPYRNLSDVDDVASDCVIWYAAAQLLGFAETKRTQLATQTVATDQSAQPPGFQQQTAAWFMSRAREIRDTMARPIPWSRAKSTLDV